MGFHMDGPMAHYGTLSHICHMSCATCQYRVRDLINWMVLGRDRTLFGRLFYMYATAVWVVGPSSSTLLNHEAK